MRKSPKAEKPAAAACQNINL